MLSILVEINKLEVITCSTESEVGMRCIASLFVLKMRYSRYPIVMTKYPNHLLTPAGASPALKPHGSLVAKCYRQAAVSITSGQSYPMSN
jgi:hypothetical protein